MWLECGLLFFVVFVEDLLCVVSWFFGIWFRVGDNLQFVYFRQGFDFWILKIEDKFGDCVKVISVIWERSFFRLFIYFVF